MKSISKAKTQIILIVGILFIFSPIITKNISHIKSYNNTIIEYNNESTFDNKRLKISKVSERIHIDNNWTDALAAGICTGEGTYSNPYIIEDLIIDAEGSGSCILIENSNVYFRIRNCTVSKSGSRWDGGIKLYNVNNSQITENNCTTNPLGINLVSSNNNTISGNTASHNFYYGINLEDSNNNTISGNTANNNDYRGINLEDSHNNNILGNTIDYNFYYAISLEDSNANTLSGNSMNECGIRLLGSYEVLCSHHIDNTNLVNGKPLYYYTNEVSLDLSNFTDAGQVILVNCNDSSISNLNTSYSSIGISLYYCNNNNISGNTANNNVDYGIYLYDSNDNNISENTVIHNLDAGIYFSWSDNNAISGNTVNDNYFGIYLSWSDNNAISENTVNDNYIGIEIEDGGNITLSGNTINYNSWRGIFLHDSNNNILSGNIMNECGVDLSGSYGIICSHRIDNTNLVNGKPLYYYTNEVGLDSSNFTNAGQIILVNCNESSISNLNTSYSTNGISLYYCNNNNISGNTASYNIWTGIYLSHCYTNTILENIASANYRGIELFSCDYTMISKNTADDNDLNGIQLLSCDNNMISGNTADKNDDRGIVLIESNNNNIVGNTANYNSYYGIALYGSNNNDITGNTLIGNYQCIFEDNCQGNTFSDNGSCTYGQDGGDIIPKLFFPLIILSVIAIAIIIIIIKTKRS